MYSPTFHHPLEVKPHDGFVSRYREAFVGELKTFLAAVRGESEAAAGTEDALAAVRAACAARESSEKRQPVRLGAQEEEAR